MLYSLQSTFMLVTSFDLQNNLTGLLLSRDFEREPAHSSLPSIDIDMPDYCSEIVFTEANNTSLLSIPFYIYEGS